MTSWLSSLSPLWLVVMALAWVAVGLLAARALHAAYRSQRRYGLGPYAFAFAILLWPVLLLAAIFGVVAAVSVTLRTLWRRRP